MADKQATLLCSESMKVVELKHYLKSKGIEVSGKKKVDLIARYF